ncbi:DEAD/DEAH box helicase [Variovorax dokdonensis]|uniref:DEAD/DEAH box helicase n=1 Tax=Variovorax dokdonensis TaxID=344883 RepID=A0ABT7NB19_9BURK|nr:DEAD/DEAH box helicase [Variovorax dokdonensis]MDM0045129.1 DEAD/DEAH box helicase [Variovorax dokdonensis]
MSSFQSLGLAADLLPAVEARGYTEPTAIQRDAIPAILEGQDVLGMAQTGSGKTAAFSLPLLQRWATAPRTAPRQLFALVLVPTRELAQQVAGVLQALGEGLVPSPKVVVLTGGVSINPQLMRLRGGADIVVATPGRLIDVIEHNGLRIGQVSMLVLDEADRLLDLGFSQELARILKLLPARRQNLLFSATFPADVQALAEQWLHAPLRVEAAPTQGVALITQRALRVDEARRTHLLRHLVDTLGWPRTLVFVATKHRAETVADKLRKAGITAEPFHGLLGQGKRSQVLLDFKAGRLQVVIATDLAARGIDIARLPVVVNYDLPRSADDYVHRIGRTGRAGEAGLAVSFVPATSEAHFRLIEKRQGIAVPRETMAGFEPQDTAPIDPVRPAAGDPNGGIKGKRPSKKDKLRAAAAAALAGQGGGEAA